MASFVPVSDVSGTEFSANLDNCNYMEVRELNTDGVLAAPRPSTTILHFPGSDTLEVTQSKEDIALMNAKLNK